MPFLPFKICLESTQFRHEFCETFQTDDDWYALFSLALALKHGFSSIFQEESQLSNPLLDWDFKSNYVPFHWKRIGTMLTHQENGQYSFAAHCGEVMKNECQQESAVFDIVSVHLPVPIAWTINCP